MSNSQPKTPDPFSALSTRFPRFSAPEIQSRPESASGFAPVRKRWVVERTNAWEERSRRNSKDYERLVSSSEAMLEINACHLMLRRLIPDPNVPKFSYRRPVVAAA